MTIESCHIISNSSRVTDRAWRHRAKYRIKTDTIGQSSKAVGDAAISATPHPLPVYFATYSLFGETDVNAFAQSFSIDPVGDQAPSDYIATVEWFPIEGDSSDDHTSQSNPLTRPVRYSVEWEEIQVPAEQGWNKQALSGISREAETFGPIQNAAGQEPSSPIMKTKRIPVLVAKKNYATLNEILAVEETYGDSVNKNIFKGRPKGEALFRGIWASDQQYSGGTAYYEGTIKIAFQRGGWAFAMVNRGWKYLDAGTLKEATVENADGEQVPVAEPANLELDGTLTPDGQVGTVIDYRTSPYKDFSLMGV